jgi:hypothetical protein
MLICLLSGSVGYGKTGEMNRGRKWVRSHPFQICAIAEGPVDIQQYKAFKFSSYMATNLANAEYPEKMFGAAAKAGLGWHWFYRWNSELPEKEFIPKLKEFVTKYPGILGVNVGDETNPKEYPAIAKRIGQVKELVPDAIVYHASLGLALKAYHDDHQLYRDYLDQAIEILKIDVLMYNLYPFNHNSTDEDFYINAAIVREKALSAGIPYWTWLQGFGWLNKGSLAQEPSESELRFQAFVSLAYGYSGMAYWTYAGTYEPYTNAILNAHGKPSPIGVALQGAIEEIKNVGQVTKNLTSTGIFFCPSKNYQEGKWVSPLPNGTRPWKPQTGYPMDTINVTDGQKGFVVGLFSDDEGRKYFMVVNGNHGAGKTSVQTAGAVTIRFSDSISKIERLNRYTGKFEMMHLCDHTLNQYTLPGGTGDLFRFHVSGR